MGRITSEGPILVLLVFSDPKHDYGLHALCERGRQGRALARWDVRGKAGRSPGTVSEFAVSLNPLFYP